MRIAIFGATSQIARDLIVNLASNRKDELVLFGRGSDVIREWCQKTIPSAVYEVQDFVSFDYKVRFDVIINFVGVGDPVLAKEMGSKIFEITEEFDAMALSNLEEHPDAKYIFISSGAVYGGEFHEPVNEHSKAQFDINHLSFTDWYAIAKFYAEARHRALSRFSIVDIRVFNYFSHTQDMNARFLITDIVRAITGQKVLQTSSDNIVRDFITPVDFFNLILSVINSLGANLALDCYTKEPVDKFTLLDALSDRYGLMYCLEDVEGLVNATGSKKNYYSINRNAEEFGYTPSKTSLEGVLEELGMIIE